MPNKDTSVPQKVIERQGSRSEPYTAYYPRVTGGVCEYCGILDPNQPSSVQYQLCPHFKDFGLLRCSYCDETKNPDEVIYKAQLNIHGHPSDPNKLIVVCDAYECSRRHEARFKLNS